MRRKIGSIDKCKYCGIDFVLLHANDKYCSKCKDIVRKLSNIKRKCKYINNHPGTSSKVCKGCGDVKEIENIYTMCTECRRVRSNAASRKYNKKRKKI